MDLEERLWTIEELFWKGDSDFYRDHLTADCLMLFPEPVGILTNEQTVGSIANAPRWSRVTIEDRRILKFSDGALILYRKQNLQSSRGEEHPLLHTLIRSLTKQISVDTNEDATERVADFADRVLSDRPLSRMWLLESVLSFKTHFAGTAFGRIMHDRAAADRHSCDTPAAHRHSAFARGFCQCFEFRASHPVQ